MWWMAIPAAMSAVGSIASVFGASSKARQMRAETDEQVRRMRAEQAQTLSTTTARAAGSGFEFDVNRDSGSLTAYLANMASEFQRQSEWAVKTGYKNAANEEWAGLFSGISGLGSAMNMYGQANNWWRTPPGGG
jgi:hypothetical protein